MAQKKQDEWSQQWSMFENSESFLFEDWIYPNRLADFKDKSVLEAGCGGGQHTALIAPFAREIVAVDLNTAQIAKENNRRFQNIKFVEADIAEMDLKSNFDIVFSIGVIHHTDNPDKTVENLKRHVKKGGRFIVWVYSREGNGFVQWIVEPLQKLFLKNLSSAALFREWCYSIARETKTVLPRGNQGNRSLLSAL